MEYDGICAKKRPIWVLQELDVYMYMCTMCCIYYAGVFASVFLIHLYSLYQYRLYRHAVLPILDSWPPTQLKKLPMALPITRHKMKWQQPCPSPKKTDTDSLSPPPKKNGHFGFDSLACIGFFSQPPSTQNRLRKNTVAISDPNWHQKCSRKGMVLEVRVFIHFISSNYTPICDNSTHMQNLRNSIELFLGYVRKLCTVSFWSFISPVSFHWASYHLVVEHASARRLCLQYLLFDPNKTYHKIIWNVTKSDGRSFKTPISENVLDYIAQIMSWQHYIDTLKIYRRYCHVHVAFCGFRATLQATSSKVS